MMQCISKRCNAMRLKERHDWQSFTEQLKRTKQKETTWCYQEGSVSNPVQPKVFPFNDTTKLALRKLGAYNKQEEAIRHCLTTVKIKED